jgi:ABC-type cobalamin/Fe3+-siderophores transport system ATPase subunit
MSIEMEIRNYRCIPYRKPLRFCLERGTTFLLGVNNAGKSTLLKFFSEIRPAIGAITGLGTYNLEMPSFWDNLKNQASSENLLTVNFGRQNESAVLQIAPQLPPTADEHVNKYTTTWSLPPSELPPETDRKARLQQRNQQIHQFQKEKLYPDLRELFEGSMLVPPLRAINLRAQDAQVGDIYVGQSLVAHFDIWDTGDNVKRQRAINDLNTELATLFNYRHFRLKVSDTKSHFQVSNDDGVFRLDELGDGIAHFIVVLLNALFKKPKLILIDEPENGLHPRMQQTFMRALAEKASFGIIAASHSIGLARSVADRSYVVTRDKTGVTLSLFGETHKPTLSEAIHELGYSHFAEIGGNNILLVEGQTDILSFREILRKFGLDQHFIIWHLGGAGFIKGNVLEELGEVKRLNAKSVSVVFDGERTCEGAPLADKFKTFIDQCQKLEYIVHPTERHSTENYISQRALDDEFGTGNRRALAPFEDFKTLEPRWSKRDNWRLFNRMTKDDLLATDLGTFVESILLRLISK